MPRVIRGTKDWRTGATILKGGSGGISKILCPTCGNYAQPITVDRQLMYFCGSCGTQFKSKRL